MKRLVNCAAVVVAVLLLMSCSEAVNVAPETHPLEKRQATGGDDGIAPYIEILRGRDGRDGRDGLPGPRGPPGKDFCCKNSPVMNQSDDLPGEKGMKGEPGPQRPAGITGAKGNTGPNGSDGRDGRDGVPGPKGGPGVDGMKGDPGPQGAPAPSSGGVTYVRWGRTICPNTPGTELVYTGRAAGSFWSHSGGGGNYQCVTEQPQSLNTGAGTQTASYIFGAEYQMNAGTAPSTTSNLNQHDVPCCVCYVATRETVLMIPGRYTCPQSWTREYYGYLMAEKYNNHRSTFECVDAAPETVTGGQADQNGALFYHVEPRCGSMSCPPYEQHKEMTCAVCTR